MTGEKTSETAVRSYKQQVATTFGKAAASYDNVARLQRITGNKLFAKLPQANDVISIDLGTGTGSFLAPLSQRSERVFACDLAPGMLRYAREHHASEHIAFINTDAEALPFASDSIDLVFSNLVLQWTQLDTVLQEINRILRPGGSCMFTTLLAGTLHELSVSWQQLDSHVHVNGFMPEHQLLQLLEQCPLKVSSVESVNHQLSYDTSLQLLRELKDLGAGFVPQRKTGLTTRKTLTQLEQIYRQQFALGSGQLPASWQTAYVCLHKPGY